MKNDCLVCHEYLFDSIKRMRLIYCRHGIHEDCNNEMLEKKNQSYSPICSKQFHFQQEVQPRLNMDIDSSDLIERDYSYMNKL